MKIIIACGFPRSSSEFSTRLVTLLAELVNLAAAGDLNQRL